MSTMTIRTIRLRKAMHYCDLYGLDREERLALAQMVLRRDITTWSTLDDEQLERMLDCLEGYGLVTHLLANRQA